MYEKTKEIFQGYQHWVHRSKKLDFLHKCLRDAVNEGHDYETLILNCLIALENNCIDDDRDLNIYSGMLVQKENDPFWTLTRGIVNLEVGKANFDLKKCMIAKDLIKKSLEILHPEKPSFVLYFLGRAYYKIGKISAKREDNFKIAKDIFTKIIEKEGETENTVVIINVLGNLELKQGNYSKAQEYFDKAIKLVPEFAYPYNGLGSLYREHRNYEKAFEYYSKAIQKDKMFMYPWNYLGDCFRLIEEYAIAIKCYNKAIEICNDKSVIFPLYGLGRVYYDLGNKNDFSKKYYNKANEYFSLALNKCKSARISQIKYVNRDMAKIQEKLGNYEEAIKLYNEALGLFYDNEFRVEEIENSIQRVEKDKAIANLCSDFEKNSLGKDAEEKDPAYYVMCRTVNCGLEKRSSLRKRDFEREFLEDKPKFDKILTKFVQDNNSQDNDNIKPLVDFIKESRKNNTNVFLHVLRKWNSYTPIINNSRGGGYFLKVNDIGIVIDPGFNFIKNFKEAGFRFSDVDVILVSHAHDDHTADLESIFNLQYRFNKRLKKEVLPREIAKESGLSTLTIEKKCQPEIEERYIKRRKILELFVTKGVYLKYCGFLRKTKGFRRLRINNSIMNEQTKTEGSIVLKTIQDGENIPINHSISVKTIKANHEDLIKGQKCIGFVLELEKVVIVYTGDTGWYNSEKDCLEKQYLQLKRQYKECKDECKKKDIVLIAHLGGFKESENRFWNYDEKTKTIINKEIISSSLEDSLKKMYYDNHLGRLGLVKLVETLEPDICLVSEFGEEFNGLRIKFTKILQEAFNSKKITFLPADIGLCLDFSDTNQIKVKAITSIDYKNHKITYKSVSPSQVKVGEYRDKNTLFYYHGNNILEGDCIQAFIEDFLEDDDSVLMS
jgi:tetratricopeptide (TPR) repeat protein